MRNWVVAVAVLAALNHAALAVAQSWPAKPVRLVVTGTPGSVTDIRGRWIADRLAPLLGQPMVVENRPGAGGNIGMQIVAASAPDGYTLALVHQGTMAINPHLYEKPGYDPLADFTPVSVVASNPLLLAVNAASDVKTVAQLIALARAQPGRLQYGSPGNGTPPHLATELFRLAAGIDLVHVPYKGGAGALADLVAGRLAFTIDAPALQLPQIRAGRTRAVAITGASRLASLPDVPTIAESGLPGYEYVAWTGIAAPARTPAHIIATLHGAMAKALAAPEARDALAAAGAEPGGEPPEAFARFVRGEYEKWGRVVRSAGLKPD